MEYSFVANSVDEYRECAKKVVDIMEHYHIFLFIGELGAGKTTLVQMICEMIGTDDVVSSPTFALINPYSTKKGMIYHMDMYRINQAEEAVDFGIEEYLWEEQYCFIEWPDRIDTLLPDNFVTIAITLQTDNSRKIIIKKQQGNH